jgi:hypothetical protein
MIYKIRTTQEKEINDFTFQTESQDKILKGLNEERGSVNTIINLFNIAFQNFPEIQKKTGSNEYKDAIKLVKEKFNSIKIYDLSYTESRTELKYCWNELLNTFGKVISLDSKEFLRFNKLIETTYEYRGFKLLQKESPSKSNDPSTVDNQVIQQLNQILTELRIDEKDNLSTIQNAEVLKLDNSDVPHFDKILSNLGYNPDGSLLPKNKIIESIKNSTTITQEDTTISQDIKIQLIKLYQSLIPMVNYIDNETHLLDQITEIQQSLDCAESKNEIEEIKSKIKSLIDSAAYKTQVGKVNKTKSELNTQREIAQLDLVNANTISNRKILYSKAKEHINESNNKIAGSRIPEYIKYWLTTIENKLLDSRNDISFEDNLTELNNLMDKIMLYNNTSFYLNSKNYSTNVLNAVKGLDKRLLNEIDKAVSLDQFTCYTDLLFNLHKAMNNTDLVEIDNILKSIHTSDFRRVFPDSFYNVSKRTKSKKEIFIDKPFNAIKKLREIIKNKF